MTLADDDLAAGLGAVLGGEVAGLRRLSGGASRQTYALTLDGRPLIAQRRRPGAAAADEGAATEAALLRAAAAAGVPVPPLVLDASGGEVAGRLGGPTIVLGHVEGEAIARKLLRDDAFSGARPRLARQLGAAAARIHRMPADAVPGLVAVDPLASLGETLEVAGRYHPVLELARHHLAASRPVPPVEAVVVHGDFRTGNVLVTPDGLSAVLDWELAHLGDRHEDLGWVCVRAWRFGSSLPAGGFGTRDELVAGYEAAGGAPVDRAALDWWEARGTLAWGVICIVQAAGHLDGVSRSVELAAIGRRVAETDWDLLELLWPDDGGTADPGAGAGAGTEAAAAPVGAHQRPTAAELVEAVHEFLTGPVTDATEGQVRFHTRVAANALAIVGRELALGPAHAAAHARRLAALGHDSDESLVAAIRSGTYDDDLGAVAATLRGSVREALAIANPTWAADVGGRPGQ